MCANFSTCVCCNLTVENKATSMQFSEHQKAKILLVDDHALVRQGVAMLINMEPEMRVCCEVSDAEQALVANRACPHDMAIVDLSLGGASGLDLIRKLHCEFPDLRILVMSMHDETAYAETALRAGASGYVMKQVAMDTVLRAIRQILHGELYISDQMRLQMLKKMVHEHADGHAENPSICCLTSCEFEVFNLIGMGMSTSEIAAKLARSIKTIESHRANIKKKLNLDTGNQLAHYAISMLSPLNKNLPTPQR